MYDIKVKWEKKWSVLLLSLQDVLLVQFQKNEGPGRGSVRKKWCFVSAASFIRRNRSELAECNALKFLLGCYSTALQRMRYTEWDECHCFSGSQPWFNTPMLQERWVKGITGACQSQVTLQWKLSRRMRLMTSCSNTLFCTSVLTPANCVGRRGCLLADRCSGVGPMVRDC